MTFHNYPKKQGLYCPTNEHDACGIGLYANIKGQASHDIVTDGLEMLHRLDHRAGRGHDHRTGDGAGIMVQLPDALFRQILAFPLPQRGDYAVGMFFFPQEVQVIEDVKKQVDKLVASSQHLNLIKWREVPINGSELSKTAQDSMPIIEQLFVEKNDTHMTQLDFERHLYLFRKRLERFLTENGYEVYIPSLSTETIVFKGLLTPVEVSEFYLDLQDERFVSAYSLVHSRYSTNTFPSWKRAHPNRYLVHNGEINTLQGNVNWMKAREQQFVSSVFGEDIQDILPIVDESGSDSSMLDNAFEFLVLAGRSPAHAAMMMIPEPWSENNPHMTPEKEAFYTYHSTFMEPWDGPTAICFTDGKQLGAVLDRNGLRPARYYVTKDDRLIYSSEVGVVDVKEEDVVRKERLSPGKMLLVDLEQGRIIEDDELKQTIATEHPYDSWLEQLEKLDTSKELVENEQELSYKQHLNQYSFEDIHKYLLPLALEGKDPIGSMGNDTPLAVLSDRPQLLFNYFKQLFAQVTNPPIDSIREKMVTSTISYLGPEGNLLEPDATNAKRIQLQTPILKASQMNQLRNHPVFSSTTLELQFTGSLEEKLNSLLEEVDQALAEGKHLVVLSDRHLSKGEKVVPVLLASSAIHQYLVRKGQRTKLSLLIESAEVKEVHHIAALIGYGSDAIYPYLVYATLEQSIEQGHLNKSYDEAVASTVKGFTDGVVKVMAKMGISTIQSYRGAQIFEAVGIGQDVISKYFTGTKSQLGGIDLSTIQREMELRVAHAVEQAAQPLDSGSQFQWRANGEHHAFRPKTIHTLQWAARKNDIGLYRQYAEMANEERLGFLRNLFDLRTDRPKVPLEEVEPASSIVKRFKTGAMSFGSLSQEAHETLAIAMNRLGGKSNSGEGGEHPSRYQRDANGDYRRSAIKQIASGRFGVKAVYLSEADELQIKMAQGAKPGEGGQLPGNKVYPWVAEVRGSTPGVGLISPPPHHDIYSIEDMAQLIHDLKNANRHARISVKLVSKGGVGTIAAGVAKGAADVIVISGYDGGTGASPKTSIMHAGLPWELGLAEAHQTLMLNGLRDRVTLETDGKLMTGKDVLLAALLGAEEFAFATAPLIVMGCVMMRACHLDTCPVGIATQNPKLRDKFTGAADHVVNYMHFVAEELREWMANLGFRTVDELVGRTDALHVSERAKNHWKAGQLDLTVLLHRVDGPTTKQRDQQHRLEQSLDLKVLLPQLETAIATGQSKTVQSAIRNTDRVVGTIVGHEVTKKYGEAGLPEDHIQLHLSGHAGQSLGAYLPNGVSIYLSGDANDYLGKGLSGGKLVLKQPVESSVKDAMIAGNVTFYGATSGEAFLNGRAGERFAVRNSGASIVVEGIGDHGCEYMTGGRVVILGDIGKNFGAGMSGGTAYILPDSEQRVKELSNLEMIQLVTITDDEEYHELQKMLMDHFYYTKSKKAGALLANWDATKFQFIKVEPVEYAKMKKRIVDLEQQGLEKDQAALQAFYGATVVS
ncbi:glutamate synthase large subunit [Tetzosporium hominis]|uniref:Glutamate synthase large subunit n=1 Tax=Tetzosporium hominis TaxID=2020506 RepID=A0A264W531_9BACL|nr:glutamate synthase large subunit [Tetzosporium hominis]OZS78682.1 glutamate synthase large subunit [Tetzosporium hominis]